MSGSRVPLSFAPATPSSVRTPSLGLIDRTSPFPRSALHAITKVSPDTPLDDTMTAMRAAGTHLAAVTGSKGTVLGFVTMEDVLEELVGEAA